MPSLKSDRRVRLFASLAALALAIVAFYLVLNASDSRSGLTPAEPRTAGAPVFAADAQLLARAVEPGDPQRNGRVFAIDGGRPRRLEGDELDCVRVYYAAGRGLCLAATDSGYRATIFDSSLGALFELPLAGVPSRARVSSDGRYGAMTVFVDGHAYLEDAGYSTETTIVEMRTGEVLADLESFAVSRGGRPFDAADFNFWGVTFSQDPNRFYATLRTEGHYFLVEGNVQRRAMRVLRDRVECPSLSPDGTRIAYKSRIGRRDRWRIEVLDLATLRARPVAERRPIDDQVEWLNDATLVYSNGVDLYTVAADGSGPTRVVARDATSPVSVAARESVGAAGKPSS